MQRGRTGSGDNRFGGAPERAQRGRTGNRRNSLAGVDEPEIAWAELRYAA